MNIYFEVENYHREMESRILLAMDAASNGHQVYISDRTQILENAKSKSLKPGVIFLKDINSQNYMQESLKIIKKNGFYIIATDEEAGIQFDNYEDFIKARSIRNFDNIDIYICWGLRDKTILKKIFKNNNTKFLALGSPRFDLCKLELLKKKKFKSLKEKISENYILFASNISFPMGIRQMPEFINNRVMEDKIDAEWREKYLYYKWTNHTELCFHFVKLIRKVAENFPNRKIIIRPHPNETTSAWSQILINKYNNIDIIKSGSIADYIFNSDLLIHSGCTSGIESFLIEKKSISYVPISLKFSIDRNFSDELSIVCKNEQEVINSINDKTEKRFEKNNNLKKRVINYKNSFSFKKINIILDKIKMEKKFKSHSCDKVFNNKSYYYFAKGKIKQILKKLLKIHTKNFNTKFPPIDQKDISEKINELKNIDKKYKNVNFVILNDKSIKIYK
jgi:surface carbohydrate biosynthesis protein